MVIRFMHIGFKSGSSLNGRLGNGVSELKNCDKTIHNADIKRAQHENGNLLTV
jgi:hypothetical protein